jgi:hypothetical protein
MFLKCFDLSDQEEVRFCVLTQVIKKRSGFVLTQVIKKRSGFVFNPSHQEVVRFCVLTQVIRSGQVLCSNPSHQEKIKVLWGIGF